MKFIHYLIYEAPGALKISLLSSLGGWGLGTLFDFITSEQSVNLAKAICAWGGVITMLLGWVFWSKKIAKQSQQ